MFEKQTHLDVINNDVTCCQVCRLADNRTHTVFGEGNPNAQILFIAEAPGQTEDETGRPFVGRAGKLLDNMILSMGLKREDVYIANIVKCRPPGNRKPKQDEMDACKHFLLSQIDIIKPKVIVALGNTALEGLTGSGGITKRCGEVEEFKGIKLIPCYHPSAILRNPNWKTPAWHALQKAAELTGGQS